MIADRKKMKRECFYLVDNYTKNKGPVVTLEIVLKIFHLKNDVTENNDMRLLSLLEMNLYYVIFQCELLQKRELGKVDAKQM